MYIKCLLNFHQSAARKAHSLERNLGDRYPDERLVGSLVDFKFKFWASFRFVSVPNPKGVGCSLCNLPSKKSEPPFLMCTTRSALDFKPALLNKVTFANNAPAEKFGSKINRFNWWFEVCCDLDIIIIWFVNRMHEVHNDSLRCHGLTWTAQRKTTNAMC